ncbi:MAG: DUF4357 domain-containing protein, partial [Arcobacter sp.]|nr:DUF4357 domain-containing protein [Arcobacter sp.]
NPNKIWGRDSILERSQAIAKVLLQIIIVNKFDKAFLNNSIKINNIYYIKRAKDVDATMEIVENGYKVYKGSKCTMKQPHKNYGWHKKRNELINNGILEENNNSLIFTEDYIFNSPSEAASIILAKQSPGPKDWKNEFNIPLRESL